MPEVPDKLRNTISNPETSIMHEQSGPDLLYRGRTHLASGTGIRATTVEDRAEFSVFQTSRLPSSPVLLLE